MHLTYRPYCELVTFWAGVFLLLMSMIADIRVYIAVKCSEFYDHYG